MIDARKMGNDDGERWEMTTEKDGDMTRHDEQMDVLSMT